MADREAMTRGRVLFDPIAATHLSRDEVDLGPMFGTEGLRVRGKVYAFVTHSGALVAKIPNARIDELTTDGATRMRMRGRELREWVEVPLAAGPQAWADVVEEAYAFVDRITPARDAPGDPAPDPSG